ncbi:ClpXP protease specificity-enhancing factor SspB [Bradyrhizobium sp. CER78]|uniref:ClpXP protease specificity-enhancing factor SspB n=1 Tax=Bradyrhizobium sp. CER78 TaxID=3039162 RepID=UPI0024493D20|nr:ClpXP protease specificity-enhancing factor SspB [Bradyrhizobium sp. CER78]MDH2380947.1 ClpXP protease specificity-enhancing factor SspB [Bradyrhizobium sp. CER78]
MWRRRGRMAGVLLLVAASFPARAGVEPCNTAQKRIEMTALLRRAAEDRPVNITFATRADGVKLPAAVIEKYPEEITIILQHEFDRLVVGDDGFEVGVWFNRKYARLAVPFDAVRSLWDGKVLMCTNDQL